MYYKVRKKRTETSNGILTKFVSIGSYSPEGHTFGTLVTSTKVFSLIISKTLAKTILYLEILDSVPRDLRLHIYTVKNGVNSIHSLGGTTNRSKTTPQGVQ